MGTREKEEFILQHVWLIREVINDLSLYLPPSFERRDLISAGTLGLLRAIEKKEQNLDVAFENLARMEIRRAIIDELRELDWVSRSAKKRIKELKKSSIKLDQKLGRLATHEDVAEELNIPVKTIYKAYRKIPEENYPLSIDEKVFLDSQSSTQLGEIIPDGKEETTIEKLELEECKRILLKAIEELPPRERLIITLYYYEKLTRKDIASILNLTEQRVFQIHNKILLHLRKKIEKVFQHKKI